MSFGWSVCVFVTQRVRFSSNFIKVLLLDVEIFSLQSYLPLALHFTEFVIQTSNCFISFS